MRSWGSNQQGPGERSTNVAQPVDAFVKGSAEQDEFGSQARRAIAAKRPQAAVEQVAGHGALVRRTDARDKGPVATTYQSFLRGFGAAILDFALPPRCAGCADVIADVDGFCPECWAQIEWLGNSGCECCGLPLEGTEAELCARCLADPPPLDRMRAAVAYGDLPRSIALRLKYGRKVALARTMARYMAPLAREEEATLIIPVPLHRWRLWSRGFNQSGLVANELGRRWRLPVAHRLLKRVKATRPLKGLNYQQRRKAVAGAFKVDAAMPIAGASIVLIDDVLTSGSTAEACARALRKAGARRVELISWARVVRPAHFMR